MSSLHGAARDLTIAITVIPAGTALSCLGAYAAENAALDYASKLDGKQDNISLLARSVLKTIAYVSAAYFTVSSTAIAGTLAFFTSFGIFSSFAEVRENCAGLLSMPIATLVANKVFLKSISYHIQAFNRSNQKLPEASI